MQDIQYQLALIDYYVAQTYPDPKGADHLAALRKAAKSLDAIYQQDRSHSAGLTAVGLYAHMWTGKAVEELGDLQTAADILDEVLAAAPEPAETSQTTGLEPLFAQAEYFRLMVMLRQEPKKFLLEATTWLKEYSRFKQTAGYQGVSLEVAKADLARAAKAPTSEKTRLTRDATKILGDVVKVHNPYQTEARRLLHELRLTSGQGEGDQEKLDAKSFEEAKGMGDDRMETHEWSRALEWYGLALKLAAKTTGKDPPRVDVVQEQINRAQLMLVRELFNSGKLTQCIEAVDKIVHDDAGKVRQNSAAAAQASAVAVTAALNLYADASGEDKKAAAAEKLVKLAEFTEKYWPDSPEADDARMARGQAKLVAGQIGDAIAIFERVNPKSDRFPMATYMAGKAYALRYLAEKAKPESTRNSEQMAADRAKAVECISTGLAALKSQVESGKPLPKYYLEMQLLLAEIYNEGGQFKEAAAIYQPLVDMIEAEKPLTLDATTLRVFLGAVRAYSAPALGRFADAGKVSNVLIDLGPDTREVNTELVKFARLLEGEWEKASAGHGTGEHHEGPGTRCRQGAIGVDPGTAGQNRREAGAAAGNVAAGHDVPRRNAQRHRHDRRSPRRLPKNPRPHEDRQRVRQGRRDGHDSHPHRTAQGASRAGRLRGSPETGESAHQGTSQRARSADEERGDPRGLGRKRPEQVRRGGGTLGHGAQPLAAAGQSPRLPARILPSDV